MGNIVVTVKNKADLELLGALAKRLGLQTFELSEQEMRLLARRKMVETVEQFPISEDISDEEIQAEVDIVRATRHAR
ncbi:MAG: hypothetical protein DYG98_21070 [Haliscomenobacteraceae bacterium CHB4]|nr:hypothetical protein [Haliscomenobacteraceae bacterium CHB4]